MSWEHPEFSFDNGQAPTPTRSPTSPSFGDSLFQTPRIDSSFLDSRAGWDSNEATSNYADILKTPRALLFSTSAANSPLVSAKQVSDERQGQRSALVANAEKLLATPNLEGLQAGPTPRLGKSPIFGDKNFTEFTRQDPNLENSTSFKSASSIQTPPPTSTSATKRKGQQSEGGNRPIKSAADRRLSVPIAPRPTIHNTPLAQAQSTDQTLNVLEFSPSVFSYDFSSPATAPAYAPAKLLWGSDDNAGANLDFLASTPGLFGTPRALQEDPFGFDEKEMQSVPSHPNANPPTTRATQSQSRNVASGLSHLALDGGQTRESFVNPSYSNAVNPSLLFSSPSKVLSPVERYHATTRMSTDDSLQPYAYQMQEAKRERASFGIVKHKKRRKPSMDSPAVQAALETLRDDGSQRPGLRRSMTDSTLPSLDWRPQTSSSGPIQRGSSPLKQNSDTMRRGRKRTSVALTIDENGRARTETRVVEDSDGSDNDRMDVDYHSDESSSSDSDDIGTHAVPRASMPRLGRFSNSASHSKKSSYTSLYSTNSYQEDPKLPEPKDRPSSAAMSNHMRGFAGKPLQPLIETSFGSNDDRGQVRAEMDSEGDDHNAQSELRKMVQRRQSGPPVTSLHTGAFAEIHDPGLTNLSPTTLTDPDLATPTSAQSNTSGGIRCVCNVDIDNGQMIQCESCRNWLHVPCTGLQPQRLQEIYLCLFCTGPTPLARGGRVRNPARRAFAASNSPLAHKTARFR